VAHILTAVFVFTVLIVAALLFWAGTKYLQSIGAPEEIIEVCNLMSHLLFWIDVGLFILFVGVEIYKLILKIVDGVPKRSQRRGR
jgi:hypothetical protein